MPCRGASSSSRFRFDETRGQVSGLDLKHDPLRRTPLEHFVGARGGASARSVGSHPFGRGCMRLVLHLVVEASIGHQQLHLHIIEQDPQSVAPRRECQASGARRQASGVKQRDTGRAKRVKQAQPPITDHRSPIINHRSSITIVSGVSRQPSGIEGIWVSRTTDTRTSQVMKGAPTIHAPLENRCMGSTKLGFGAPSRGSRLLCHPVYSMRYRLGYSLLSEKGEGVVRDTRNKQDDRRRSRPPRWYLGARGWHGLHICCSSSHTSLFPSTEL